jgi:hypothetical protein
VVSSGSTADEDLPEGVVARVNPGPEETRQLGALLAFLLGDEAARERMERLSLEAARSRPVGPLTERLASFVSGIAADRAGLESRMRGRASGEKDVRELIRDDIDRAATSLGLTHLPPGVFERLAGL